MQYLLQLYDKCMQGHSNTAFSCFVIFCCHPIWRDRHGSDRSALSVACNVGESGEKQHCSTYTHTQCIKRRHWDNYQAASCQVAAQKGDLAMQTNTLGRTAFRRTTHTHALTVQIKTMAECGHKRLLSAPRRESGGRAASVSGRRATWQAQ